MTKLGLLSAGAVLVLAAAAPAWAHHSFAMFDNGKEQIVSGSVAEFQWTNPHTWIELDAPDGKGGVRRWSIEGGSPTGLARQGWNRNLIKAGDKVRIAIHPFRNGDPGGSLIGIELPSGRVLGHPLERPADPQKPSGVNP